VKQVDKVKQGKNDWETWADELDGVPLKNGEKVKVRFPDGAEFHSSVICEKRRSQYSDHGTMGYGVQTRAYVRIIVHGLGLKIRLAEHAVEVEREDEK
jgi:hypothetical protein